MRTRRAAIRLALAGAALAGALAVPALAEDPKDPTPAEIAAAPGTDIVEGKADAPVQVVEYASMTCTHCASFHVNTYPEMKRRYIDTGKVRFTLRPFPLDNLAVAAFMLAKCRTEADYYPFIDLLFRKQAQWAFTQKPVDGLRAIAAEGGIEGPKFESCLKDQALLDAVIGSREYAAKTLHVAPTPTFFVDGRRVVGGVPPERLDEMLVQAKAAPGPDAKAGTEPGPAVQPAPSGKDGGGAGAR